MYKRQERMRHYGVTLSEVMNITREMNLNANGGAVSYTHLDVYKRQALRLKFPPSPRSGNYPVIMEGVGKSYGDHVVFKNCLLYTSRCV